MERRTLIVVVLCLVVFLAYPFILKRAGLDRYMRPPGQPPATERARPPAVDSTGPAPIAAPMGEAREIAAPTRAAAVASASAESAAAISERLIQVETSLYRAWFSTRGARLLSVELAGYASAHGPLIESRRLPGAPLPDVDRVHLTGSPSFVMDLGSGASLRGMDRMVYDVADSLDAAGRIRVLRFTGRDPQGATVRQTYRLRPDDYAMDLEVEIRNVPLAWRTDDYTVTARSWPLAHENDPLDEERSLKAACLVGTNLHREMLGALRKGPKVFEGNATWSAVQTRYFSGAVAIARGSPKSAVASIDSRPLSAEERERLGPLAKPTVEVATSSLVVSLPGGEDPVNRFLLYFGPNEYFRMARLGHGLERLVDLGWTWIRPLSKLLLQLLLWLHGVVRNYGVAIVALATLVRMLLHPLGMMSIKSMRAMQRVQPETERIRAKHKNDAQAMNKAMMALYKENSINPAGGCLPMVVQMPLFIALYSVLFNAIELRQAPFVAWMQDLSAPDLLFRVGSFPVRLMPLIMAGSGFLQQWMTPTDPRQATSFYLMNAMMLVFFYNLPSGLVLYWTVMNLLTALQQWLALREDGAAAPVVSRVAGRGAPK